MIRYSLLGNENMRLQQLAPSEDHNAKVELVLKQKEELEQLYNRLNSYFCDFESDLYIARNTKIGDFERIRLILNQFNRFIATNKRMVSELPVEFKSMQIKSEFVRNMGGNQLYEEVVTGLKAQGFEEIIFYK